VGRLSGQETTGANDWSEMAGQTITWGEELLGSHQTVPEGPVRDALSAVDQGSALDPKAADWPRLRSKLEDLLKKSEDEKQNQQKQDQQKQDKQDKDQQKQQKQDQKSSNSGDPQKNSQQNQKPGESGSPQNPQPDPKSSPQNPQSKPESAFGDMNGKPEQKAQPPGENQQVGGRQENKRPDPAQADPSLATPLQKLDQLRDDDAPAELYQMIENNEPHPPQKKGKNW
jgi:Ca-activated chloride channel family protein